MKRLLGLILISVSSVVSMIVSIIGRYRIPFKIIKALTVSYTHLTLPTRIVV